MAEVPELLRSALRGRYDLERELGRGGMATVYLARELRDDRPVAIKVLNPDLTAAVGRARFLREIKLTANLAHPHILTLIDHDEVGDFVFYVMPYVEGESLKQRIEREKQLPVADAIAIARDIAAGLGYAHSQGIVHRDIKPGNILLQAGSATIADFGIARAIRRSATDDTLTDVTLAIGTPPYMSPEQWSGARELDARSDIYSLGCVVYEMLAGQPPFTGTTTEAIAARVAFDPVPPIRTVRPRVSAALEQAILRALEKVPADRWATVTEFAEALADAAKAEPPSPPPPIPRWAVATAGGVVVATVAWTITTKVIDGRRAEADTTRYVVLPFDHDEGVQSLEEDDRLTDALSRWTGITVVPQVQAQEAVRRQGGAITSGRDARRAAERVGAGRFVRGRVSAQGDSVRIWAGLYGLVPIDALIRQASVRVGAQSVAQQAPSAFFLLADSLLFAEAGTRQRPVNWTGTRSAPARQAYGRGHAAIEEWDLAAADSAFATAAALDPLYAQAHLWLAQVRAWSEAPPVRRRSTGAWRSAAERAVAARGRLTTSERIMADALYALAGDDLQLSCTRWRDMVRLDSLDFVAWYGLGSCLAADEAVVWDARSPSGRSFRSSYGEAMRAYQRAYRLMPSVHRALRAGSYQSVRALLKTRITLPRRGRGLPPDTVVYAAYPEWRGDSLAFVPRPFAALSMPVTGHLAVRHQRQQFHEIALGWAVAYPQSPDAMEALALALEMIGDPAALDTIRHARALATTPDEQVRAAGREVWMRLRRSAPHDLAGVRAACAIADSLLRRHASSRAPEPMLLASLAALTGRARLAASYIRQSAIRAEWDISPALAETAPSLLVFAALGGPTDSLRSLEGKVDATIEHNVPPDERLGARLAWLARSASLAFPHYRFATLDKVAGDELVNAQRAFVSGDVGPARRMFARLRPVRAAMPPEEITLDAVYPEAALLAEMADTIAAIAWLDRSLAGFSASAQQLFDDPARSASLAQAMLLRATLADAVGDREAADRWGRVVAVLWSKADSFLRAHIQWVEGATHDSGTTGR